MAGGLTIRGLAVPPSIILARVARDPALTAAFGPSDFAIWPDNRAMLDDLRRGAADLAIIPTNVAATLATQDLPLGLARVTVWGILHVVAMNGALRGWGDLAGRSVAVPLRGNMPDTIFATLLARAPVDGNSVSIAFQPSYVAALDAVVGGAADAAVLPEPLAAVAVTRGARRMLDLQQEWGALVGGPPRYPQAGVVVHPRRWAEEGAAVGGAVDRAVRWLSDETAAAGALGATLLGFDAEVVASGLRHSTWISVPGAEARAELEHFFRILAATSSALLPVGLPADGFYLR